MNILYCYEAFFYFDLKAHKCLDPLQSNFQPDDGTETALVFLIDDLGVTLMGECIPTGRPGSRCTVRHH